MRITQPSFPSVVRKSADLRSRVITGSRTLTALSRSIFRFFAGELLFVWRRSGLDSATAQRVSNAVVVKTVLRNKTQDVPGLEYEDARTSTSLICLTPQTEISRYI